MQAMTGEEKAGLLLLSLDSKIADAVLAQLGPGAKARLAGAMQRLKASPQRTDFAEQILEEMEQVLQKPALRVAGSSESDSAATTTALRAYVPDAMTAGQPPGHQIATRPAPIRLANAGDSTGETKQEADPLAALNQVASERLMRVLDGENPRTIALVLNYLTGDKAGELYKQLQAGIRREVSVHMATCVMPGPEVVHRVVAAILAKEQSLPEVVGDSKGDARFKKMAELLWKLERTERTEALAALQDRNPDAASQVRELLYQFTDLLRLDSRSIQKVLGQMDGKMLAVALKGADEDVKQIVLDNMSKRAKDGLLEEIDFLGAIPANQIQQAQKSVVEVIQHLDQAGELVMLR